MDAQELITKYAAGERDFTAILLCEANLSRIDLSGANFSEAILSLTNMSGTNLSNANMRKAKLNVARLSGANLYKANLSGAILNVANLIRADLREAQLVEATMIRSELIRADLSSANLTGANLSEADLREATLREANLEQADLSGAHLRGASLIAANLERANLHRADLSRADLRGVNLCNAELRQANLSQANLSGADLRGANLRWADLSGANLSGADLDEARLSGANLYGANLSNVNLLNATLVHADLTQANLIHADWVGADLTGAALTGAKIYAVSRFDVKADDITCDWVDLSPNGDRSHIQRFTPEESQRFFNATPPTVQIIVDRPLDPDANFVLAATYRQIARQYPALSHPPSIEVNSRRTIISFKIEQDEQLFPTAFVAILPFSDAAFTQKNLITLIKMIQPQSGNNLGVRVSNMVVQLNVALTKAMRKIGEMKIQPIRLDREPMSSFFQSPTQTVLANSSAETLMIHYHPDFGRNLTNLPGVNKTSISPGIKAQRFTTPPLNTVIEFVKSFYQLGE
ncbi:pentapeptide repeat-containing protein [Microcoleus vaginatus GB2-A3]|uniref:pentapeptide repeat-containing protein n=1 Tax=Microcoleus TaxID=44471 RepID=UPI002FD3E9E9